VYTTLHFPSSPRIRVAIELDLYLPQKPFVTDFSLTVGSFQGTDNQSEASLAISDEVTCRFEICTESITQNYSNLPIVPRPTGSSMLAFFLQRISTQIVPRTAAKLPTWCPYYESLCSSTPVSSDPTPARPRSSQTLSPSLLRKACMDALYL
jgi:hypothetical protein